MHILQERIRNKLQKAGIENSNRLAQDLICHVYNISPVQIITGAIPEDKEKEEKLFKYADLLESGKPIQYVLNSASFLSLDLYVDERVLIPRPETEILASLAEDFIKQRKANSKETLALDLCTGSGCIALYMANAGAKTLASDISRDALEVAKFNARNLNLKLDFYESDLFKAIPLDIKFDLITANPPYIPKGAISGLDPIVRDYEPVLALDGGELGYELPDRIVADYSDYLNPGGLFLMEIGDDQGAHYKELCPNGKIIQDLEGHDRILAIRKI